MFSLMSRGLPAVRSLALRALFFAVLAICATPVLAQSHGAVQISAEVKHDTSPALRDLPSAPYTPTERAEHDVPLPYFPPNQTDGALQHTAAPSLQTPAVISSVDGVGSGFTGPQGSFTVNSAPPDTNGAVGATQYVQIVNSAIAIFDKTTKAAVLGPKSTNTLWSGFGGVCQTDNDGDGVVVYDKAANRWVISQFAVTGAGTAGTPYLQCVAVSTTSDATGTYNRYAFSYGTTFPDYPKMGVWPDGYYTTFNMFAGGTTFAGANLCAYDRAKMLTGAAATQQCFQLSTSFGGVLPADLDGSTAPPVGAPNYLINFGTNSLNLWKFHVDWTTPANTTLTGPTNIAVAAFSPACGGATCITQSGTNNNLDSLADRMMFRLAYRNFGTNESLVVNNSVTAGTATGVRWYEIRSPGTTPVVYQQSTFAPDSNYRWMGSVAMDQQGNMALGYSVSSKANSVFPSISYTGRLASDALSTMQSEVSLMAGAGSQTGTLHRWGDYSAMTIDPTDDCTFWFTTEYLKAGGTFNWSTRIGSFKFPSCGATSYTVTPSVTGSGTITPNTPQTVSSGATTIFTLAANAGNRLVNVTGTCGGTLAGNTFTTAAVTTNCTVIGNFVATHTVTPSVTGSGTITPNTVQTIDDGATTIFTLAANAGNRLVNVTGTCGGTLAGNTFTTAAVTANCTVIANFAIDTYTVTAASGGNGTITPASQTVNSGSTASFVVTPSASYHVVSVSGDTCTVTQGTGNNWASNAITQNCAVTATFASNPPTQLVFVLQPANGTAAIAINTVTIEVRDAQGNVVIADNNSVTLSVTGPGPFDPVSTMTVNSLNGVATFSNLIFDVAGTGYQLTADDSADSLTSAASNAFNIAAGTATKLVFTTQPTTVNAGSVLNTIAVQEEDASGNFVNDNGNVSFTVPACSGSVSLGTVVMVNGAASLTSSKRFYTVTNGLHVTATATAANGTSAPFNVLSGDMLFTDSFDGCRL